MTTIAQSKYGNSHVRVELVNDYDKPKSTDKLIAEQLATMGAMVLDSNDAVFKEQMLLQFVEYSMRLRVILARFPK